MYWTEAKTFGKLWYLLMTFHCSIFIDSRVQWRIDGAFSYYSIWQCPHLPKAVITSGQQGKTSQQEIGDVKPWMKSSAHRRHPVGTQYTGTALKWSLPKLSWRYRNMHFLAACATETSSGRYRNFGQISGASNTCIRHNFQQVRYTWYCHI